MAWTAPRTWTVGEVLTAANMNAQLRDNLKALAGDSIGSAASSIVTAIGANDGLTMRVRAGSSPYDFLALTYDATYGKWVSEPEFQTPLSSPTGSITQNDVIAPGEDSAANRAVITPWKALVDAGLTPQVRLQCFLSTSDGTKTANVQLGLGGANADGGLNGLTAVSASSISTTSTSSIWKDGGWATPTGHTDYDMEVIGMQGWRASGGTGKSISYSHIRIGTRWTY